MNDLILYTTEDGRSQIKLRAKERTVWLTQLEMAELFDATKLNISLHLKNVFEDGELDPDSVVKESLTTAADGKRYGVFYCARKQDTAIAETRYHAALFMAATREPPMRLEMRLYTVKAKGEVADLRKASRADPRIVDPDDYGHVQGIGRKLRSDGVRGILYPSVRHPSGECLAAFSTALLKNCLHAAYLEYHWNGQGIDAVFDVNQVL